MPCSKASRPFPQNVHRDCQEGHGDRDAADGKKAAPHALDLDPVVGVEREAKGKHVLEEVDDGKSLGCLLAVAIAHVRHDAGGAELDS